MSNNVCDSNIEREIYLSRCQKCAHHFTSFNGFKRFESVYNISENCRNYFYKIYACMTHILLGNHERHNKVQHYSLIYLSFKYSNIVEMTQLNVEKLKYEISKNIFIR